VKRTKLPGAWRKVETDARKRHAVTRTVRTLVRQKGALPPTDSAKVAGLRYVNDQRSPGIRRVGPPKHFRYVGVNGRPIRDAAELQRIKSLAVPPAWTDVWICADPRGHLQAVGRDARGRKQYRYHPQWREVRDEVKYGRLAAFAEALPKLRKRVDADLRRPGLPREKVLAAVVQLLEKTLIRVGNEEYARENGSVGLTTMRDQHAKISGTSVRFEFRGKSGIEHAIDLPDARLAKIVKACRDLPGYDLFQYVDADGRRHMIGSADVNAYLREVCGQDFTAKDFRTWAGTVLAAKALAAEPTFKSATDAKRKVNCAIASVAQRLGNTKAICRKSYIHPAILDAYMNGATIAKSVVRAAAASKASLSAEESAVVRLLERAIKATRPAARQATRAA
jgi:DNA topoisomerase-1